MDIFWLKLVLQQWLRARWKRTDVLLLKNKEYKNLKIIGGLGANPPFFKI